MSGTGPRDRERMHYLMMATLDGEIAPAEREELDRALAEDAALRKEWCRMSRVKEVTSSMVLAEPPAELWDEYWDDVFRRNERRVGWVFASLGASLFLGWGLFEFLRAILLDAELPLLAKGGLLLLSLGGAVLLVSVVREKFLLGRRDPYREVKR